MIVISSRDRVIVFLANYLIFLVSGSALYLAFLEGVVGERVFAAIIATILGMGLKYLIPVARPYVVSHRDGLVLAPGGAFPSVHTAFCFALVSPLVGGLSLFQLVLSGLSLVIGFSRVSAGVHYPRDIVGGALFGIVCGWVARVVW